MTDGRKTNRGNQGWNPCTRQRLVLVNCKMCGNAIECYPSQKRIYCSNSCRSKAKSEIAKTYLKVFRKENHYNWKGGISSEERLERLKFRKKIQRSIFVRDNYTCTMCGKRGGRLQVDHIKSWSKYPHLRFNTSNCRTLCMSCHYFVTYDRVIPEGTVWGHNLVRTIK